MPHSRSCARCTLGETMIQSRKRPAHLLAIAILAAIVTAGCGGDTSDARAALVPLGAPVAIQPTADLDVGVLEGDPMEEFDRVTTPFLMPNGTLAVPTRGARTIRLFSPDGAFVESYGGPGEGPGEFGSLGSAWARGDTIEAYDGRLRRITRFIPGGEVEVVTIRGTPVPPDRMLGPLGDGWALTGIARITYGERDPMSVLYVSRDGAYVARLADAEGMARFRVPGISGPHPLTPIGLFDVHAGEVYAAETLTPAIRVYDGSGTYLREIALAIDAPAPASSVFRQVIDSAVARADEDERTATRRRLSAFPEPDRLSSFWDFIVDEAGYVWVRPYEPLVHALALGGRPGGPSGPGGNWLVISPEGAEVGRLEVPAGLELVQITSDAVVGLHRDDLGIESVRVHSLSRR